MYNLGTGKGVSVRQLVTVFERVTGATVPLKLEGRREGDICAMWADPTKAKEELNWTAKFSLEDMCKYILIIKYRIFFTYLIWI